MTTVPASDATLPIIFPDANFLKEKAASDASVLVYQGYMTEEQRLGLSEGAVPFDISFNKGSLSREYEQFQRIHAYHQSIGLDKKTFWGMVSAKFPLKSAVPFPAFLKHAEGAFRDGMDGYAFNPFIGNFSFYSNVWEQGRLGHQHMTPVSNYLQQAGHPIARPQGLPHFFFCNYFCGNDRFWTSYFEFCEKILSDLEDQMHRGTEVGLAYAGSANYKRSPELTMRPFVIERLLGLFLLSAPHQGLRYAFYQPSKWDFDIKFGKRLSDFLYDLFLKKMDLMMKPSQETFDTWNTARLPIFTSPHIIHHSDDPPNWLA